MFSKQETFNLVVNFLRQQGEPSATIENGKVECRYYLKKDDGKELRCAAGCLSPGSFELYEGDAVSTAAMRSDTPFRHDLLLTEELQVVHDVAAARARLQGSTGFNRKTWLTESEKEWTKLARQYDLVYTPPTEVTAC